MPLSAMIIRGPFKAFIARFVAIEVIFLAVSVLNFIGFSVEEQVVEIPVHLTVLLEGLTILTRRLLVILIRFGWLSIHLLVNL